MLFKFLAVESNVIWSLFTALTLLLPAFWTLEAIFGVMFGFGLRKRFSIFGFFGSIRDFSFLELILFMTFLTLNEVKSLGVELFLKFSQDR